MGYTTWHHIQLARFECDSGLAVDVNVQFAFEYQKKVVALRVRMPAEFALHLDDHHVVPIEFTHGTRLPVAFKGGELGVQVYGFLHENSSFIAIKFR